MSVTDDKVAEATAKLDDNLKPAEDENAKDKPEEDKKDAEAEKETGKTEPEDDKGSEGFTADEADTDEDGDQEGTEEKQPDTGGLTPEQKYIYDNLPAIQVVDNKGKVYSIKTDSELPRTFEFANKTDEIAFMRNLSAQELNARELQTQFRTQAQTKAGEEFEARENSGIKQDISDLQKSGDLPKFKTKIDDPKFDDDPATKDIQTVLDFMNERNEQYLQEYNQGRPFRHIGFKDAFTLYNAQNPGKLKNVNQKQEDTERKEVARKLGSQGGVNPQQLQKPVIHSGTSTRDLLARIEAMDI